VEGCFPNESGLFEKPSAMFFGSPTAQPPFKKMMNDILRTSSMKSYFGDIHD